MDSNKIITPTIVSEMLQIDMGLVIDELESGRLKGFRIGREWRTTLQAVWEMVDRLMNGDSDRTLPDVSETLSIRSDEDESSITGIPQLEQLKHLTWEKLDPCVHYWPNVAGKPAREEQYDEVYGVTLKIRGKTRKFVIAFGNRTAAGMDRRRCVIFDDKDYPIVEFAGANDFRISGKMASVIIRDGRKQIPEGEPLPVEYHDMPTGVYNTIVNGPYASRNQCVVAHHTDFSVMIKHALIRCYSRI